PSIQYVAGIAGSQGSASCLVLQQGQFAIASTGLDEQGGLDNGECVVGLVSVQHEGSYFIAGSAFDIELERAGHSGTADTIAHFADSVQLRVENGWFELQVYPRAAQRDEQARVWSGQLFVGGLDEARGVARLGAVAAAQE